MTQRHRWVPMLLATAWAQALLTAGFVLVFDPTRSRAGTPAAIALFGVGALVAMALVIDRLVPDALPAAVVGLKLSALLLFCGGGAWVVRGVLAGYPGA